MILWWLLWDRYRNGLWARGGLNNGWWRHRRDLLRNRRGGSGPSQVTSQEEELVMAVEVKEEIERCWQRVRARWRCRRWRLLDKWVRKTRGVWSWDWCRGFEFDTNSILVRYGLFGVVVNRRWRQRRKEADESRDCEDDEMVAGVDELGLGFVIWGILEEMMSVI